MNLGPLCDKDGPIEGARLKVIRNGAAVGEPVELPADVDVLEGDRLILMLPTDDTVLRVDTISLPIPSI